MFSKNILTFFIAFIGSYYSIAQNKPNHVVLVHEQQNGVKIYKSTGVAVSEIPVLKNKIQAEDFNSVAVQNNSSIQDKDADELQVYLQTISRKEEQELVNPNAADLKQYNNAKEQVSEVLKSITKK
ncbi:hypothetical protein K5I29_01710 [Flavobacterium agricola]|uniref:Uncharacterized protein n=1 Tax=Flavobacterium agricola TaxID=2870839 RepID=A0ABY6LZC2_9FLAO|nr:hypothetical protein [Flavobacterium agricola]UYW01668.1 hypothetical protein K5I29_01710 [Flavobacterium agricola]